MAKTTKEKPWNAWVLDNVEDLQSWSAAGVIGMATLGGWCGNEVPRLKSTGGMTMELALKLMPTLRSTSVAGIYRAVDLAGPGSAPRSPRCDGTHAA